MILAERAARLAAEADRSNGAALMGQLKLQIEKLRRELYGSRSERKARLLDQMELELEELEAAASEDERAARGVHRGGRRVRAQAALAPPVSDAPAPGRVVIAAPERCPCCGSAR